MFSLIQSHFQMKFGRGKITYTGKVSTCPWIILTKDNLCVFQITAVYMDPLYKYLEYPKCLPQGTCRIEWRRCVYVAPLCKLYTHQAFIYSSGHLEIRAVTALFMFVYTTFFLIIFRFLFLTKNSVFRCYMFYEMGN